MEVTCRFWPSSLWQGLLFTSAYAMVHAPGKGVCECQVILLPLPPVSVTAGVLGL